MTTERNLLRLRIDRQIEQLHKSLVDMTTKASVLESEALTYCATEAQSRLATVMTWVDACIPREPEPPVTMGATDDLRG